MKQIKWKNKGQKPQEEKKEKEVIPQSVPEWWVNRRTGEARKTTKTQLRKYIYHLYNDANMINVKLPNWEKASKEEAEILENYPD